MASSPAKKRGSRASGTALQRLLPYLLRLGGRKILVIFIISIAKTALSNRLARLQVAREFEGWEQECTGTVQLHLFLL